MSLEYSMEVPVYSSTGEKKGSYSLPPTLFEQPINIGLMHQTVLLVQNSRRLPIAHVKRRSEVRGSTRKLYAQKGTGRARRGDIRSPLLRGGGKSFGPRKERMFQKNMPRKMRRYALLSSLSLQAKKGAILGLESYPDSIKTKEAFIFLQKLPITLGRRILFVLPTKHQSLKLSVQNIPGVEVMLVSYLNPEAVLSARYIIFLVEAIRKAEEIFGKTQRTQKTQKIQKNTRTSSESSGSSGSSESS